MPKAIWKVPLEARKIIWDKIGYEPLPKALAIHLDEHRLKLIAGGERASKSYTTAMEGLIWACMLEKGLLWIVAIDYEQSRNEFRYMQEALGALGALSTDSPPSTPKIGSWQMWTKAGTEISTKSAHDAVTLAGRAPDGVLLVEAAQCSYEVFLRCRGRVAQHRGPLLLSGTFEQAFLSGGWYTQLYEKWGADNLDGGRSFSMPTWENTHLFPGGREDPEIKSLEALYPHDVFQERFGALPCPPSNRVFRAFDHTRHVSMDADFDKERAVQLWVDPGYASAYAVLAVQRIPGTDSDNINHIDEIYMAGTTAEQIIEIAKGKSWWPNVRALVMDVASAAHPGAESQTEIWFHKTGLRAVMNKIKIPDGILRYQTFLMDDPLLGRPRTLIHPRCTSTIAEHSLYRYADVSATRADSEMPIDRDNHAMKAIAYGLVANFGFVERRAMDRDGVRIVFKRK